MKIFYVIPPKGKQYSSQADAQSSFEAGEVWRCTGWAIVDDETHVVQSVTKYPKTTAARYSQGIAVRNDEGEIIASTPRTWAMQWRPGRVSFLKFHIYPEERKVSLNYGPGKGKALLDEHPTPEQEYADRKITRKKAEALKTEFKNSGGWLTSSGLRFRPFQYGEEPGREPFPLLVWQPSGLKGYPHFDANPACRTLGDRELEKWYTSALHRAKNPYGRQHTDMAPHGVINSGLGSFITPKATDSDDLIPIERPSTPLVEGYAMGGSDTGVFVPHDD